MQADCARGPTRMKWTTSSIANACKDAKSVYAAETSRTLPDGAFVALEEGAFAVRGDTLLRWTPEGYQERRRRPRGVAVDVLTPPAILAVLSAGYHPHWHPSAETPMNHTTRGQQGANSNPFH